MFILKAQSDFWLCRCIIYTVNKVYDLWIKMCFTAVWILLMKTPETLIASGQIIEPHVIKQMPISLELIICSSPEFCRDSILFVFGSGHYQRPKTNSALPKKTHLLYCILSGPARGNILQYRSHSTAGCQLCLLTAFSCERHQNKIVDELIILCDLNLNWQDSCHGRQFKNKQVIFKRALVLQLRLSTPLGKEMCSRCIDCVP